MIEDMKAYKKAYYEEHKEHLKKLSYENLKQRYHNDDEFREKIKAYRRDLYNSNPEIRERKRKQYLEKKQAKKQK